MGAESYNSYVGSPIVITDYKRFARRVFCLFIFIAIGALTSIFTLGANTTLIKSSTAMLKVDTRNASVHDILGGVELLPIEYSTTYTTTSISTSTSYFWLSTSLVTKTLTQTPSIPTSDYLDAKSSLENLTEILNGIDSYVTVDDFSLARVFYVHDHLYLATAGYRCWSDHLSRHYMGALSASSDSCSSNGFLQCFGREPNVKSESRSSAYNYINTDYLSETTSLSESEYDYIYDLWSNVLLAANESTLKLNIDPKGYKAMHRLLCANDYFRKGSDGIRKYSSMPYILGLTSFCLTVFTIFFELFVISPRMAFVIWFLAFGFIIATFAISFNSNVPAAKYINLTEGIKAKTSGLVGYFVGIVILNLVALLLIVIEFRKQKQEKYDAEHDPLNSIPLDNDPPNLPPSYDNIAPKLEQEPLNKH